MKAILPEFRCGGSRIAARIGATLRTGWRLALVAVVALAIAAPATARPADVILKGSGTLVVVDQAGEANDIEVRISANGGVELQEFLVGFNTPLGVAPESTVAGPPGAVQIVRYAPGVVTIIAVEGREGNDTITLVDTPGDIDAVSLLGGTGADTIEVLDTHTADVLGTAVNGNEGSDIIRIFDAHGPALGVGGGAAADTIEVFDTSTAITTVVSGEAGNDFITVHDASTPEFRVLGGDGSDSITLIDCTDAGATVVLSGDAGNDAITIQNAHCNILAAGGGDGDDLIDLIDSNTVTSATLIGDSDADASPLVVPGMDTIIVRDSHDDVLLVVGGPLTDVIAVQDTHTTTSTQVQGNGGSDIITIDDAHGPLIAVSGDADRDLITVNDSHADVTQVLGAGGNDFIDIVDAHGDQLGIDAGANTDGVLIRTTHTAVLTQVVGGSGADDVTIEDANGPLLAIALGDGNDAATVEGLGLDGGLERVSIDGEGGVDVIHVDGPAAPTIELFFSAEETNVNNGGLVQATGSILGPMVVHFGGRVDPGPTGGTGLIGVEGVTFEPGSNYDTEINDILPGADHDAMFVIGATDVSGSTLNISGTWAPRGGDEIAIIINDEADPVVGEFLGLPENTPILLGGVITFITYKGGDGNDVVIFCPDDTVASPAAKGSLVAFAKVELRWAAAAPYALIQDTFLTLTNDFNADVSVQLYFVNGDPPLPPDPFTGEPAHPGWNTLDNAFTLTANQPTYWAASSGQPATGGLSPFTALDPSFPPGRPAPDGSGDRVLRGYVIGWAVDADGAEIRWNHLAGNGTIVNYATGSASEYGSINVPVLADVPNGAAPDPIPGLLRLDGDEYAPGQAQLLFNFQASGSFAFGAPPAPRQVLTETALTLMPLEVDLRQATTGPVVTKASVTVWNENEVKFSGLHRCVICWDQTLLSQYGVPNHFLRGNLQTDHGKARIDGVAAPQCPFSRTAALVGVAERIVVFDPGMANQDLAAASTNLVGMGMETAVIIYDVTGGGQEAEGSDAFGDVGQVRRAGRVEDETPPLELLRYVADPVMIRRVVEERYRASTLGPWAR